MGNADELADAITELIVKTAQEQGWYKWEIVKVQKDNIERLVYKSLTISDFGLSQPETNSSKSSNSSTVKDSLTVAPAACPGLENCQKIAIVMDKDMLDSQVKEYIEKVCGKCEAKRIPEVK
jgi:hypothetical protein